MALAREVYDYQYEDYNDDIYKENITGPDEVTFKPLYNFVSATGFKANTDYLQHQEQSTIPSQKPIPSFDVIEDGFLGSLSHPLKISNSFDRLNSLYYELSRERALSDTYDFSFLLPDLDAKPEPNQGTPMSSSVSVSSMDTYCQKGHKFGYKREPPHSDLVTLEFTTKFLDLYYRNDRKNLQCFPYCPIHGDYLKSRLSNSPHKTKGSSCSAPIDLKVISPSGFSAEKDSFALGRVSLFNSDIEKEFDFNLKLGSKERIISSEEYRKLALTCASSGVDFNGKISFKSSSWRLDMQLNRLKKPTSLGSGKLSPSEMCFIFEVFLLQPVELNPTDKNDIYYKILARTTSSKFLIKSTRTLLRMLKTQTKRERPVDDNETFMKSETEAWIDKKRIKTSPLQAVQPTVSRNQLFESSSQPLITNAPPSGASCTDIETKYVALESEQAEQNTAVPVGLMARKVSASEDSLSPQEYGLTVINENDVLLHSEGLFYCIFLGFFGAHWFYLNRPKLGLLYISTFGLFGLGYLHDIVTAKAENEALFEKTPLCPATIETEDVKRILAIFPLGILGVHWFHFGRPYYLKGILYSCTLGLFGLGYIHDILFFHHTIDRANKANRAEFCLRYGGHALKKSDDIWKKIS
eukprot:snap_masked-scaffold_11-processed-gene-1.40-mRNA-1 protein AED:1.00 eAED:1.00 QI:0/0/0/0/1/1/2/0/636